MPLRKFLDPNFSPPEGERWTDLSGYEAFYRISDHGRLIKKAYYCKKAKTADRLVPARLVKPVLRKSKNIYVGDSLGYLYKTVSIEGKSVTFGLGRMVYYHFVAPFDLADRNLFIFYKDKDHNNLYYANLILGDQQLKQQRMLSAARRGDPLGEISAETREAATAKMKATMHGKSVYQISRYNLSGILLESYPNAAVAAAKLDGDLKTIQKACKGRPLTYKGYLWRRGIADQLSMVTLEEPSGEGDLTKRRFPRCISQYDLEGRRIQSFPTIRKAAQVSGYSISHLSDTLRGKYLTCGPYFWRRGNIPSIEVQALKNSPSFRHTALGRAEAKISKYDLNGLWKASYISISAAAKENKIDPKCVANVLKEKAITAGGFLWHFGQAPSIDLNEIRKKKHYKNSRLEKFWKRRH
ncbi:NUMOD1 domain-containing DNA-binding protein [Pedobacter aquatilis]|uniref:NUMOD1 domain-containing DNA-binding protein n=1 Tax=Pedobacter aquatilis TaxID=351343 RepID=UPI00292EC47B|nr:NUMOD1 domain-containing DNA-binding protein [Pedobacter aquatilis]